MTKSFQWSLKPLLLVMKGLGMNLDHSSTKPTNNGSRIQRVVGQCLILVIGFGLLASNLVINCMSLRHDLMIKGKFGIREDLIIFGMDSHVQIANNNSTIIVAQQLRLVHLQLRLNFNDSHSNSIALTL